MQLENVKTMKESQQLAYAVGIIVLNRKRFTAFEKDYYRGSIKNKKPHGLNNSVWKRAAIKTNL